MKKTLQLFSLVLGVLAVGSVSSLADGEKEEGGKKRGGPQAERGGKDGERRGGRGGRGGRPELTDVQKKQMEAARKKADANGDGKIEGDERKALMTAIMTIRADANGDGKLDEAEQAKYDEAMKRMEEFRKRRAEGGGEGRPEGRPGRRPGGGRPGGKDGDKPQKPEKPDS